MKTFVLTGATSGIGLEAARFLGKDSKNRILAGARDPKTAGALKAAVPGRQLELLPFDASSLESVNRFASLTGPWDGLAANAGLQIVGRREESHDGFEKTFAVNCLANHALITALLPSARPAARVVITASGTHDPADSGARFFGFRGGLYTSARELAGGSGDLRVTEAQRGRDRYSTSKLCAILEVYERARRHPQTSFFAYDPGLVPATGLARNRGLQTWLWNHALPLLALFMPGASNAARSGSGLAWMLTCPELEGSSGLHYSFTRSPARSSADSYRTDWAAELFDGCRELCEPIK